MQPDDLSLANTSGSREELILRNFAATIGRKRYEHWFKSPTEVLIEGNELVVAVSTPFLVNWMAQNFRSGLLRAAVTVIGDAASIRFAVKSVSSTGDVSLHPVLECVAPSTSANSDANAICTDSTRADLRVGEAIAQVNKSEDGWLEEALPHFVPVASQQSSKSHHTSLCAKSHTGSDESSAKSIGDGRANSRTSIQLKTPDETNRDALVALCREKPTNTNVPQPMSIKSTLAAASGSARKVRNDVPRERRSSNLEAVSPAVNRGGKSSQTSPKEITTPAKVQQTHLQSRLTGAKVSAPPIAAIEQPETMETPNQALRLEAGVEKKDLLTLNTRETSSRKLNSERALSEKKQLEPIVTSVARNTREPALTVAKVKPVTEPPRNQRRYADLLDLVEGSCNEFALSAARQVCQAPGVQFTSLFVHGPVGVGKTHVLEGIHKELKQRFPTRQIVYLTAEAYANYFTQALRDHKLPSFRQKFRALDVLIVDDIDFLDGKRGIQEEFLFTVQQLEAHGRVVVMAAHGHPRLLTKMSEELRTRFMAGMVCRIDAPDVVTRRRIVENKAFRAGADFAPEVFNFVADRFRNNVRELEGAFNTLLAHQRMQNRRLSLSAARSALADLEKDCIRVVRIADIEQVVCTMFGITNEDLKSTKRQQSVSQPRMLAMYLARKHTRSAYTEIGQYFGGRNHSTVMAAEKKIRASLTQEQPLVIRTQSWRLSDLIETLEQQLQAS